MATTLKNYLTSNVGTSPTVVYTAGVAQTTIYSFTVANIKSPVQTINVSAFITSGVTVAYLIKNAPIPTSSTLVIVGEPQKLAMESGDTITVVADVATAADVVISTVELS
jgi:SpoU rRNA methylase family enzyme